jgi:hypothetical protein
MPSVARNGAPDDPDDTTAIGIGSGAPLLPLPTRPEHVAAPSSVTAVRFRFRFDDDMPTLMGGQGTELGRLDEESDDDDIPELLCRLPMDDKDDDDDKG